MIGDIDKELWEALSNSPFNTIDYENLLATNPIRIRKEEMDVSLSESPLAIPQDLTVSNIYIPSSDPARRVTLRIYGPKGLQGAPIFVFFHGGAFIYGTPEQYDFTFFKLALDVGMLIVSVDYRLAPEQPFPAGMQDGYDTLLWLSRHADQIGGDRGRLLIGGSSAGATIAASVALLARDRREVCIEHQYLLYPPMSHLLQTDSMHTLANVPMQTRTAAAWMWHYYLPNEANIPPKYAVPLLEDNLRDLPDSTIIVCEFDPFKDEGILYAEKLKKSNVSVTLMEVHGAVHAFDFFSCSLSDRFYDQQVHLFKQILGQGK